MTLITLLFRSGTTVTPERIEQTTGPVIHTAHLFGLDAYTICPERAPDDTALTDLCHRADNLDPRHFQSMITGAASPAGADEWATGTLGRNAAPRVLRLAALHQIPDQEILTLAAGPNADVTEHEHLDELLSDAAGWLTLFTPAGHTFTQNDDGDWGVWPDRDEQDPDEPAA